MKSLFGVLLISAAMIGSGIYLAYRSDTTSANEQQSVVTDPTPRPSPIAETLPWPPVKIVNMPGKEMSRARAVETPDNSKAELPGTDWAVVAAIYNSYEAAERRARNIAAGSAFRASVHPPKGQGGKYMVVLASGLTQGKANDVRERALSGGLPGDTYVTRLRSSSAE